jgi:hypothetical protein
MPVRIGSRFIPRGSSNDIWTLTQPATSLLFQIDVRSKVTGQSIEVNWGDGSANTYTLKATVDTAVAHTYASGAVYAITITGAQNIVRLTSIYTDGRANWGANISAWTSLTYLTVTGSNTLSGSVAALTSLTYMSVTGSNTLSGSVAALTSLTILNVQGSNTLSGSVAALTSLTSLTVTGSNTLSGSVAALTSLTSLNVQGSNTLSDSVAALINLTTLFVTGSNTLSGSVAALTSLTYLYVTGSNTLSGSVAALTSLTLLRVTGGLNTIDWTTVGPLTKLTTLNASNNALSQAQVDALLLAMYTARATYVGVNPAATLGGTNSAPSGVYADEDPPVTGKGMIYELVNDPETEGFTKWAITYTA